MAKKVCIVSAGAAVSALLSSKASTCFDYDDDDDLPEVFCGKRKHPKVRGFVADIIPGYSEIDFRCHFRLSRSDDDVGLVYF